MIKGAAQNRDKTSVADANLFPKDLHLVMGKGATLSGLGDLAGKRDGIAQAGSGTQVAVLKMLEQWGVNRDNMNEAELNNSQSAERLLAAIL